MFFLLFSFAAVCIFSNEAVKLILFVLESNTHTHTHTLFTVSIYKLCLKLLWTCHKIDVRFPTVCQNTFFLRFSPLLLPFCQREHFINGKSYELCESCDICIFCQCVCVCVCESVLMMIQVGLIANLYAEPESCPAPASCSARLGCPFIFFLLPLLCLPWNVWLLVLFIFFDKVLPI